MQSQYKSLLISERTTIDDLIELLLRCHNNNERIERFSIYEVKILIVKKILQRIQKLKYMYKL